MNHICILADALPSWVATLSVVAFVVSIIGNLAQYGMYKTMRQSLTQTQQTLISPQPFIVAMEKEFATKRDLEKFQDNFALSHKEVQQVIGAVERGANERIANELQRLREERKGDVGALHEKINAVGRVVAGLEKETELQNQKMASMDAKLDRLIERV